MKDRKRRYKLSGGRHTEEGCTYSAGDEVPSSRDLVAIFRGKFELLEGFVEEALVEDLVVEEVVGQPKETPKPQAAPEPPYEKNVIGRDVTANFDGAREAGFSVYRSRAGWKVCQDELPISDHLQKKDVLPFIEICLEEAAK